MKPPSRRDSIGLVPEMLLPQKLDKVPKNARSEHLRVQGSDAIDMMGSDDGQMGHPHLLHSAFLDQGHANQARSVIGEALLNGLQKKQIQVKDDGGMPGKQIAEHWHRPLFQCLRKDRVVCEGKGPLHNAPSLVPPHPLQIHQNPLQFDNAQCWMRVIQLNGNLSVL